MFVATENLLSDFLLQWEQIQKLLLRAEILLLLLIYLTFTRRIRSSRISVTCVWSALDVKYDVEMFVHIN